MKTLRALCIIFIFTIEIYSKEPVHQPDIHKYITYQAWELVKYEHPEVINSEMNLRVGNWNDGTLNGSGPWQKGKIVTGAFREDKEDVVYKHNTPGFISATHFWNADFGDYVTFNPEPYTYFYANSYQKCLAYWYGNVGNNGWLELGPFFYYLTPYYVRVKYNNLAQVYQNNSNFLVTHWFEVGTGVWHSENPPEPLIQYLLYNSPGYSQAEAEALIKRICWEIVGRVCHLIEDSGIPAHAHNDPHPISDYFEDIYMPQHYQEYDWTDALSQGGLININNKLYPIRFALYTTNQIADRFRSDDVCGDLTFPYPPQYISENYEEILNPIYQSINSLNVGVCDNPASVSNIIADKSVVYSIRSVAGFLWYVYNAFNIQNQISPSINSFTKNLSDQSIYRGEKLIMQCNASGSNLNYSWFIKVCDSSSACNLSIPGISLSQNGNQVSITNHSFRNSWTCGLYDSACSGEHDNRQMSYPPLNFYVGVKVYNQFGQVTKFFDYPNALKFNPTERIRVAPPPPPGCPYYCLKNGDNYVPLNNVLHSSQFSDNKNKEITDKIFLTTHPEKNEDDSTINLAFTESGNDISIINKISLLEVIHPLNTSIGVTHQNDIVMYNDDEIASPKYAEKSGEDVTEELEYDTLYSHSIKGNKDETLISYFYNKINSSGYDSVALFIDPFPADNAPLPTVKEAAGKITFQYDDGNLKSRDIELGRRQLRSGMIIPSCLKNNIFSTEVSFSLPTGLTYTALGPISYSGFKIQELKLVNAENTSSLNLITEISETDSKYAILDSNADIMISFKEKELLVSYNMKKDYVLVVTGKVNTPEDASVRLKNSQNSFSQDFPKINFNYPNPFNPRTIISYELPKPSFVKIVIYDNLGKEVSALLKGRQDQGNHYIEFDGSNYPSGVYYCKISVDNVDLDIRKMVLLK